MLRIQMKASCFYFSVFHNKHDSMQLEKGCSMVSVEEWLQGSEKMHSFWPVGMETISKPADSGDCLIGARLPGGYFKGRDLEERGLQSHTAPVLNVV